MSVALSLHNIFATIVQQRVVKELHVSDKSSVVDRLTLRAGILESADSFAVVHSLQHPLQELMIIQNTDSETESILITCQVLLKIRLAAWTLLLVCSFWLDGSSTALAGPIGPTN